jgi:hypothetical protein
MTDIQLEKNDSVLDISLAEIPDCIEIKDKDAIKQMNSDLDQILNQIKCTNSKVSQEKSERVQIKGKK